MARRVIPTVTPPTSVKDGSGAFMKAPGPSPEAVAESTRKRSDLTLVEMLERQMLALERTTVQLAEKSVVGLTEREIQSLATCMKLTMELRDNELELLDKMNDEELKQLAESHED